LALVQLEDYDNRPARLLSGGQQQRVALARALAVNPAVLLMDEPLSNLDARLREEVRANIKKLAVRLGITVVYVTHDQVEAMVVADRIAVMAGGEILQTGKPFELYRRPASALVAEFFGSINWLRGNAERDGRVDTEIGLLSAKGAQRYEGAVAVGIRPEDIKLGCTSVAAENRLEGRVLSSTFVGDQRIAEVRIKDKTLIVKAPPDDDAPAEAVWVHLPKDRLVVFPEDPEQKLETS
jgi:ABC-type sugar transport system ATPase subunit